MSLGLRGVVIGPCGVVGAGDLADGIVCGFGESDPAPRAVAQALDEQAGDAGQDHLGGWLGVVDLPLGGDQDGQEPGIPQASPVRSRTRCGAGLAVVRSLMALRSCSPASGSR